MPDEERIPEEIFQEAGLVLNPRLKNFLVDAAQHAQNKGPWVQATSAAFSSKLLERALDKHAQALVEAAEASNKSVEASNKNTESLKRATWMLVFATVVLALVTLGLWLRPF